MTYEISRLAKELSERKRKFSDDNDEYEHQPKMVMKVWEKYELVPKSINYIKKFGDDYTTVTYTYKTKNLQDLESPQIQNLLKPFLEYTEGDNVVRVYNRQEVELYRLQQQLQEVHSVRNVLSTKPSQISSPQITNRCENENVKKSENFINSMSGVESGYTSLIEEGVRANVPPCIDQTPLCTSSPTSISSRDILDIFEKLNEKMKPRAERIAERDKLISQLKSKSFEDVLPSTKKNNIIKEDIEKDSGPCNASVATCITTKDDDVKKTALVNMSENDLKEIQHSLTSTKSDNVIGNPNDVSKIVQEFADNLQQRDVKNSLKTNLEPDANDFPNFSESQITTIRDAMDEVKLNQNPSEVLKDKFRISITRKQINSLQWNKPGYLNDQVINFYLKLVSERGNGLNGYLKVHNMDTIFYQKLLSKGYDGVKRWTKNIDIFTCDLILVPIHIKDGSEDNNSNYNHWCMAIIYMKAKTIKYYDSMDTPNGKALQTLLKYLGDESLDKRKLKLDFSGWSTEHVNDHPRQRNGYDCGVFICMYAEFTCRNRPLLFNQDNMVYLRKKMVLEICEGQLLR